MALTEFLLKVIEDQAKTIVALTVKQTGITALTALSGQASAQNQEKSDADYHLKGMQKAFAHAHSPATFKSSAHSGLGFMSQRKSAPPKDSLSEEDNHCASPAA